MEDFDQQLDRFSPTARLFGLVSGIPQEQLVKLLKQLLGEVFNKNLFRMIIELSDDQQRMLLQRLEGMKMEDGRIDRRGYQRKPCLISVTYSFNGRNHKSFILDISSFGVFIETRNSFPVGHEISMTFTVPSSQIPFQLTGQIVWSGLHGIGVKFKYLTQFQLEMIRAFSERMEEVYDIIS